MNRPLEVMQAPIWLAFPPEVHSASLSSGPGSGPLLATAAAWASLSTEYTAAADELTALLGSVQAGAWQGGSAERYAAAHGPYLSWLAESAAKSAVAAAHHQTAAGAHSSALASMPTLAELATNHTVHASLVATNFFGINTIPIALNEADYVRMWVQAATTMASYQAVTESALAAVPATTPAPPIVAPGGEAHATAAAPSSWQDQLAELLSHYTQDFAWPLGKLLYPDGWPFEAFPFASGVSSSLTQVFPWLAPTLASALGWTVFHTVVLFWPLVQAAPLAIFTMPAAFPAVGALGAIGAVGAVGAVGTVLPPATPIPAGVGGPAPTASTLTGAPTGGVQSSVPTTPTAPNPAAASPALSGSGPVPPGGSPGVGFGPTNGFYLTSAVASAAQQDAGSRRSRRASESTAASEAVPAEAADAEQARARKRRQRAKQHDFSDEYMTMNIDVAPDWGGSAVSDRGAGALGFAGTVVKERTRAAGLATLAGSEFGGGPQLPMVPSGWADPLA